MFRYCLGYNSYRSLSSFCCVHYDELNHVSGMRKVAYEQPFNRKIGSKPDGVVKL